MIARWFALVTRALIAIAVGLLATCLGALNLTVATATSAGPQVVNWSYDGLPHAAMPTHSTAERGPPVSYDPDATCDVVAGGGLHGCATRSRSGAPAPTTAYTTLAARGQITTTTTTTAMGGQVAVVEGDLSSPEQLRAAAKTTTSLADEASSLLGNADDVVVLGRQADTAVAKGWEGHVVLDTPNWSLDLNDAFIRGAIDQRRSIYLASPLKGNLVQTSGRFAGQPTVYARELQMLREAGYTRAGDYMVPR